MPVVAAVAPDGTRLHLSAQSITGYKGVFESLDKSGNGGPPRYQAQARIGGRQKYIGIFPTVMEAAIAVARVMGEPSEALAVAVPAQRSGRFGDGRDLTPPAELAPVGADDDVPLPPRRGGELEGEDGADYDEEMYDAGFDDDDDAAGPPARPGEVDDAVIAVMKGPELRRAVRAGIAETGLTQSAFAHAMGVSPAYLSQCGRPARTL